MDIGVVDAPPDYTALISRLAISPPAPPLSTWIKLRRIINKKFGQPATRDVGILAEMLASLRDAASTMLSTSLDRVAISHPPISGLARYDLYDALDHVGLKPWLAEDSILPRPELNRQGLPGGGLYPEQLTELHAVYAAHGYGLCEHYTDLFMCWEEENKMSRETVMVAGLTTGDLRAELVTLQTPFYAFQPERHDNHFVDLTAGLDTADRFESDKEYWAHVRNQLGSHIYKSQTRLSMVLLTGENATHPDFLYALREAMVDNGYHRPGLLLQTEGRVINPTYASARGAAHYAWWRQEAPVGCQEPEKCSTKRGEHGDMGQLELR